jgi:hypothetical protein
MLMNERSTEGWPESDKRTVDGVCCHCEREAVVQELDDPYLVEAYPDEGEPELSWWCYECLSKRMDEV